MRSAGLSGDEEILEPTPIAPLPDLGPARRSRRRRRLLALWSAVVLLLVGQIGTVLYLRLRHARRKISPMLPFATPAPARVASPLARDAGAATQPTSLASRPAALDAAVTAQDARPPVTKIAKTVKRKTIKSAKRATRTQIRNRVAIATPKPQPEPLPAPGPVDDIAVPAASSGNAAKGERLLRMGCGLCHGQRTKPVNPSRFTAKQWKLYFARAAHGRHNKLRAHFTRAELADVKAHLISTAGGR